MAKINLKELEDLIKAEEEGLIDYDENKKPNIEKKRKFKESFYNGGEIRQSTV